MPTFRIQAEGTAHEVYYVDAPNEETARQLFNDGNLTHAAVLEVEGSEIIEIKEIASGKDVA
jgi:hypothetical protein